MSAYAPTKTYTRAVSANLEFQRQLGLTQNSIESKKHHARCDLNTQIITLREQLYNIRARTPTILPGSGVDGSGDADSGIGSPRCSSSRRSSVNNSKVLASSSALLRERRASSSRSSSGAGGGGSGDGGISVVRVRASIPKSTIVHVNTSPLTLAKTLNTNISKVQYSKHASPRTGAVQVAVGIKMPSNNLASASGDKTKQKIDVRITPTTFTKPALPVNGNVEQGTSETGVKQNEEQQHSSTRKVVFSAHIPKRKLREISAGAFDSEATQHISENQGDSGLSSTDSSRGPTPRQEGKAISDRSGAMSTGLVRMPNRSGTIITPGGSNSLPEKSPRQMSIVPMQHPSMKATAEVNRSDNVEIQRKKLALLRPSTASGISKAKPSSRNPFYKLEASTEKRIDQVESIRISLHDLYQRRLEKTLAAEEEKSLPVESNEKTHPTDTKTDTVNTQPSHSGPGVSAENQEEDTDQNDNASIKVLVAAAPKRSSRYFVHQMRTGPLAIPGVSSNQLRELEKFRQLMDRRIRSSTEKSVH